MKTGTQNFSVSALALAVRGALCAMFALPLLAQAQEGEDEVKALTTPTNVVQIGVQGLSDGNSKYAEYTGLEHSGGYLIGNFELRGGDSYRMGEGTRRWEAYGTDLGTTSRALGASIGDQGQWKLGVGFDQLRHYTTGGSYQTPYLGSQGSNHFKLPADFGAISTRPSSAPGARSLTADQLGDFRTRDVYTQRDNTSFSAAYRFNLQWDTKFEFNHLEQSGAKLIAAGTDAYSGGPSGFNYRGENIAILMNPTESQTDTLNLAVNWVGERAHASVAYFGSFYRDRYRGLSFDNPFVDQNTATGTLPTGGFALDTMSTPPSNDFHQLNLTGGYAFSSATKLVGGLSYGRNTQNVSYAGSYTTSPDTVPGFGANSLDGLVITRHADLKLTHRYSKDLSVNAGFKYNERDNQTPSRSYTFLDLGGAETEVVNTPMSNRRYQFELGGDYRITSAQHLHLGYEYDHIKRWCNNSAANNAQGVLSATNAGYYTDNACAQVPENRENRISLGYRLKATESLALNAGYTYGRRTSRVNDSFYNPMQAQDGGQGFENYGYLAFFQASRKEHLFKAGVNWQATDRLSLGLNGRYTKDDYDSTLGVQTGDGASLNLDASYSFSEYSMISAYTSWERRTRDLTTANGRNAVAALPNLWSNTLTDSDQSVGIGARQKKLLSGKLELREDFSYTVGKTHYSTGLDYASTSVGVSGDSPEINSRTTQLKLTGTYALDKASAVILGYRYQHLHSNDYFYNAYQYGFTPSSLIPTNQQSPDYTVNTLFAIYQYSFM